MRLAVKTFPSKTRKKLWCCLKWAANINDWFLCRIHTEYGGPLLQFSRRQNNKTTSAAALKFVWNACMLWSFPEVFLHRILKCLRLPNTPTSDGEKKLWWRKQNLQNPTTKGPISHSSPFPCGQTRKNFLRYSSTCREIWRFLQICSLLAITQSHDEFFSKAERISEAAVRDASSGKPLKIFPLAFRPSCCICCNVSQKVTIISVYFWAYSVFVFQEASLLDKQPLLIPDTTINFQGSSGCVKNFYLEQYSLTTNASSACTPCSQACSGLNPDPACTP